MAQMARDLVKRFDDGWSKKDSRAYARIIKKVMRAASKGNYTEYLFNRCPKRVRAQLEKEGFFISTYGGTTISWDAPPKPRVIPRPIPRPQGHHIKEGI